jgi:hypothetical protein
MLPRKGFAFAALLLTALVTPAPLRAELTYYTYTGSVSPNPIRTDGNVISSLDNNQGVLFVSLPGGHYTITGPIYTNLSGQPVVRLYAFNNDPQRTTVTFNKVPFILTVDLQQFNPFFEAKETYHGLLRGTANFATHTSTLTADIVDGAPRNLYFGPIRYYFVANYFNPLQWDPTVTFPAASTPGAFVTEIGPSYYLGNSPVTTPNATPEPSSMALAGIGLACTFVFTFRCRNSPPATVVSRGC